MVCKNLKNGKVSAWSEKFSNKFDTKFSQIKMVIIYFGQGEPGMGQFIKLETLKGHIRDFEPCRYLDALLLTKRVFWSVIGAGQEQHGELRLMSP